MDASESGKVTPRKGEEEGKRQKGKKNGTREKESIDDLLLPFSYPPPLLCFSLQIALRDSSEAAARKEILRGEHGAITTGKWGRNREEKREEEMPEAQNAPKSDPPPRSRWFPPFPSSSSFESAVDLIIFRVCQGRKREREKENELREDLWAKVASKQWEGEEAMYVCSGGEVEMGNSQRKRDLFAEMDCWLVKRGALSQDFFTF